MDPIWLATASFPVLLVLIFLRVPIGLSMLVVGLIGSWQVYGSAAPLLNQMKNLAYSQFSSHSLSIVPLFLLMGQFATLGGMSQALFKAAEAFIGHRKGGVGMAAIGACAGFGAICGSSLATAATMGQVALPELQARRLCRQPVDRRAGGRRHAGHPDPAVDRARHLRHPGRAEHRQALCRGLHPRHPGGAGLHAGDQPRRAPAIPSWPATWRRCPGPSAGRPWRRSGR